MLSAIYASVDRWMDGDTLSSKPCMLEIQLERPADAGTSNSESLMSRHKAGEEHQCTKG